MHAHDHGIVTSASLMGKVAGSRRGAAESTPEKPSGLSLGNCTFGNFGENGLQGTRTGNACLPTSYARRKWGRAFGVTKASRHWAFFELLTAEIPAISIPPHATSCEPARYVVLEGRSELRSRWRDAARKALFADGFYGQR